LRDLNYEAANISRRNRQAQEIEPVYLNAIFTAGLIL